MAPSSPVLKVCPLLYQGGRSFDSILSCLSIYAKILMFSAPLELSVHQADLSVVCNKSGWVSTDGSRKSIIALLGLGPYAMTNSPRYVTTADSCRGTTCLGDNLLQTIQCGIPQHDKCYPLTLFPFLLKKQWQIPFIALSYPMWNCLAVSCPAANWRW